MMSKLSTADLDALPIDRLLTLQAKIKAELRLRKQSLEEHIAHIDQAIGARASKDPANLKSQRAR